MKIRLTEDEKNIENNAFENLEMTYLASLEQYNFLKDTLHKELLLILDQYQTQLQHLPKRIEKRRDKMIACIITFIFMFLLDTYFTFLLNSPAGEVLSMSIEMFVASVTVFVLFWKSLFWMIDSIIEYKTQCELLDFSKYKLKYNVFTLRDEERYCQQKIADYRQLITDLINTSYPEELEIFRHHKYEDKRAYASECSFFQEHQIPCFIVICLTFVVLKML